MSHVWFPKAVISINILMTVFRVAHWRLAKPLMTALGGRPSVKDADLLRVCGARFISKSSARARGTNTHTARYNSGMQTNWRDHGDCDEIICTDRRLKCPCTHSRIRRMQMRQIVCSKTGGVVVVVARWLVILRLLSRRRCRRRRLFPSGLESRELTLRKHLRRRSFHMLYAWFIIAPPTPSHREILHRNLLSWTSPRIHVRACNFRS